MRSDFSLNSPVFFTRKASVDNWTGFSRVILSAEDTAHMSEATYRFVANLATAFAFHFVSFIAVDFKHSLPMEQASSSTSF